MTLTLKEEISRLFSRGQNLIKERGLGGTVAQGLDKVMVYSTFPFHKSRLSKRKFMLQNQTYPYFCHHYNATWRNERTVEVALAKVFLEKHKGEEIFEIGNVTAYYFDHKHIVVDKYEKSNNVLNVDIMDYNKPGGFDAIICLSTLEHVGWDETPREPQKIESALQKIISLLKPGGELLLTVPFGHNAYLDSLLESKKFAVPNITYMKRVSSDNEWREVSLSEVEGTKYGEPYLAANAIAVAIYQK